MKMNVINGEMPSMTKTSSQLFDQETPLTVTDQSQDTKVDQPSPTKPQDVPVAIPSKSSSAHDISSDQNTIKVHSSATDYTSAGTARQAPSSDELTVDYRRSESRTQESMTEHPATSPPPKHQRSHTLPRNYHRRGRGIEDRDDVDRTHGGELVLYDSNASPEEMEEQMRQSVTAMIQKKKQQKEVRKEERTRKLYDAVGINTGLKDAAPFIR